MKNNFKDGDEVTREEIENANWDITNRNSYMNSIEFSNESRTLGVTFYNDNIEFLPEDLEKIDDRLLKFSSGVETLPNTTTQKSAGNIGLMDYRGNVIASEQYISVDKINNYLLRVRVAGGATGGNPNIPNPTGAQNSSSKYGIIDYSGRTVLSPQYDYISKVNNTILRLKKGNSWGRAEYYNGNIINVMFDYQSYW